MLEVNDGMKCVEYKRMAPWRFDGSWVLEYFPLRPSWNRRLFVASLLTATVD